MFLACLTVAWFASTNHLDELRCGGGSFFRLFSVGFSFIRVCVEFAFILFILFWLFQFPVWQQVFSTVSIFSKQFCPMTYYSMTLFCLHKPFGWMEMWRWLLSSFFVPSRFIRVRLEFAFTFLHISHTWLIILWPLFATANHFDEWRCGGGSSGLFSSLLGWI